MILREGADKVAVNSAAILNPTLVSDAADKFGRQCVVVAIDAKRRADGSGWTIYKNGGRVDMGKDAVEELLEKDGKIEVHCHYCNTDYVFFRDDFEKKE